MAAACEPIQKDKCSLVGLGLCTSGSHSVCIQSQRNAKKQFIECRLAGLQSLGFTHLSQAFCFPTSFLDCGAELFGALYQSFSQVSFETHTMTA